MASISSLVLCNTNYVGYKESEVLWLWLLDSTTNLQLGCKGLPRHKLSYPQAPIVKFSISFYLYLNGLTKLASVSLASLVQFLSNVCTVRHFQTKLLNVSKAKGLMWVRHLGALVLPKNIGLWWNGGAVTICRPTFRQPTFCRPTIHFPTFQTCFKEVTHQQ